jgi:hypothetical protein
MKSIRNHERGVEQVEIRRNRNARKQIRKPVQRSRLNFSPSAEAPKLKLMLIFINRTLFTALN